MNGLKAEAAGRGFSTEWFIGDNSEGSEVIVLIPSSRLRRLRSPAVYRSFLLITCVWRHTCGWKQNVFLTFLHTHVCTWYSSCMQKTFWKRFEAHCCAHKCTLFRYAKIFRRCASSCACGRASTALWRPAKSETVSCCQWLADHGRDKSDNSLLPGDNGNQMGTLPGDLV